MVALWIMEVKDKTPTNRTVGLRSSGGGPARCGPRPAARNLSVEPGMAVAAAVGSAAAVFLRRIWR